MSKIGKQPIEIPDGVNVTVTESDVTVKGPKGELKIPILDKVKVKQDGKMLIFSIASNMKQAKSNWGTQRALVQNAVKGVVSGFEKTLIIEGVGYRVTKEGESLNLNLGFSHSVKYAPPQGITFEVEKNSTLKVKGIDKGLVGKVAADIRQLKKPEPYKGKGFRYSDEIIRRKTGKKAAGATTAS